MRTGAMRMHVYLISALIACGQAESTIPQNHLVYNGTTRTLHGKCLDVASPRDVAFLRTVAVAHDLYGLTSVSLNGPVREVLLG
jgi:hypothetical protein